MNRGLFINADDWGRSVEETDRIVECVRRGPVRNASAMVWMADSERAATLSRAFTEVDFGLHLNFTEAFSAESVPDAIRRDHERAQRALSGGGAIRRYLPNPGCWGAFSRSVVAQIEEFERLYGRTPERVDGHLHMHLSFNGLWGLRRFAGQRARRNFTFEPGEKSWANRCLRDWIDRHLARRFSISDRFYSLETVLKQGSLERVVAAAQNEVVELMTHPIYEAEGAFLLSPECHDRLHGISGAFRDLQSASVTP